MNVIDEKYISSFLPIQELDEVRKNPITNVADISADDLFFMSQISAYATGEKNAIAVSKKIRYQDLIDLLSVQLSIPQISLSIDELSTTLSILSTEVNSDISSLSNAIVLSVFTLSAYIDYVKDDLSSTIVSNYVTKYSEDHVLIRRNENNTLNPATFASEIHLEDGRLTITDTLQASSLIVPKDWKLAQSGIRANDSQTTTIVADGTQFEIIYPVLSDCYINCMISAYEQDSTDTPIYVQLVGKDENNNIIRTTIDQLNNAGGYSGVQYFNYYHSSFPLKTWNDTSVVLKYSDNSAFSNQTSATFTEYPFYAVVAKDDLSGYVQKQDATTLAILSSHKNDASKELYLMQINDDGLVKDVSAVYYGLATNSKMGMIKLNSSFQDPKYGVKLQDTGTAYVQIDHATQDKYGTIKLNSNELIQHNGNVDYGLKTTDDGNGYVTITSAMNDVYGLVKTNSIKYEDPVLSTGISAYIQLDNSGHAYVVIPSAIASHYGVIKPGLPEETRITMSRSVYVNKDGYAVVNIASNFGVGQYVNFNDIYDRGYDTSVIVDLSYENMHDANEIQDDIMEFTGNLSKCKDYGNYAWIANQTIEGAFVARIVYEGTSMDFANNATLQIICDGNAITTIDISSSQTGNGKKFISSQNLGVFEGNEKLFAAVSNNNNFNNGKLYFLIKHLNYD